MKKLHRDDYKNLSQEELVARLTDLNRQVTLENGTERPFDNEYNDNYKEGIYVDLYTGEPLFSSKDKFDSGCGWSSFSQPLAADHLEEKEDTSLSRVRTEVRSKTSDAHLGHVFNDGPQELGGLRYCINSAAVQFIAKEEMEELGYGSFLSIFE